MQILDRILLNMGMVSELLRVLPLAVLAAAVFAGIRLARRRRMGVSANPLREGALALLVCYMVGLLALTITPPNFWSSLWVLLLHGWPPETWIRPFSGGFDFTFSLFRDLAQGGSWVRAMAVGNVAMFFPLGLLVGLTARRVRGGAVLLVCLGVSLAIELIQPVVGRSFDVSDLVYNTLGGAVGFAAYLLLRAAAPRLTGRCRGEG